MGRVNDVLIDSSMRRKGMATGKASDEKEFFAREDFAMSWRLQMTVALAPG